MTIITNAHYKIWAAIKERLQDWTECHIMMPNDIYTPGSDEAYIIVQHTMQEYSGTQPLSAGCGAVMSGILTLSVMVPIDYPYDAHIGMAGRLSDMFPASMQMTHQDMTVQVNGKPRVLGNVTKGASWNRVDVDISWLAWG